MAFTFTVEDGSGLTTATSYTSTEEADSIVAANIHAAPKWGALDNQTKGKLLTWATRIVDSHTRWNGQKVGAGALRWPRSGVIDRDGLPIPSNIIPPALKLATATLAVYMMEQDRFTERDQDAIKRIKADVAEIEFVEGYRLPQIPSHITHLLTGLGSISTGTRCFARVIR